MLVRPSASPDHSPARLIAMMAALIDRFHMLPEALARLTAWQVWQLYLHRRDDEGRIEMPPEEIHVAEPDGAPTLEGELASLAVLAAAMRLPDAKVEELRCKIREKFADGNQPADDV